MFKLGQISAAICALSIPFSLSAQEPENVRTTDISILYGISDSQDFESADEDMFSLSTSSGDTFAVIVNHFQRFKRDDRIFYEFYLARTQTDVTSLDLSTSEKITYATDIDHYHVGGIFEFQPPSPQSQLIPYFGGTLGMTKLSPEELSSESFFSISVAGGAKWMLSDNVGLRLDGRVFANFVDSSTEIFCSGGCIAKFEGDVWWQYQMAAGITVAF